MKHLPTQLNDKREVYLGTSLEKLDEFYELGDFGEAVFTDSLNVPKDDSYRKELEGFTGMVLMARRIDLPTLTLVDRSENGASFYVLNKPVHPSKFVAI
ncbi:hypothetical protein [Vibrio hepatarius]|uniref:hypothetical protein n=1 Tax=Vibrio hepatarius TaxID=171383 RepID=UPI001C09F534|nr:hypothetical protein [Vibrio hepatarius]MBU2898347.1 hypothetical protein [Vibrio hepatarius]